MIVHQTGGNTVSFQLANVDSVTFSVTTTAICGATITDSRDSQIYKTASIGNACWMAENLRFNAPGSYLNPNNPSGFYGRLYDWATLMNGSSSSSSNPSGVQGICPNGWHLPSDAEWNALEMALGMPAADTANTGWRGVDHGTKMKALTGWNNNGNGTNTSGLNMFATGFYGTSAFGNLGLYAYFSSTTAYSSNDVWTRTLNNAKIEVDRRFNSKQSAFSCRCVMD
jgi:uncharacterized protein (TIGR02145 family)